MIALALAAATIACVVVVLVGVPGAPVREADARHIAYSSISGKLSKMPQGTSVASGSVYLYRWNGSSWVSLGKKATSNQYVYYTISGVPSGYYYHVKASKAYGICQSGQAIYGGSSNTLDLRNPGSSRTVAHIPLYFQRWFSC